MTSVQELLNLDCAKEVDRIGQVLKETILKKFRRRGIVVALSGGIDSSVTCALCVEAFGKSKVLGLFMPEKESSKESGELARLLIDHFGIDYEETDITSVLESVGCYQKRDQAIQSVIPEYDQSYTCKIVLPSLLEGEKYRIFSAVVQSPDGKMTKARLTPEAYRQIVAATNFKQRVRKMLEYYHADRLHYVVTGTPNRLEYDQGFFVKLGDGAADIKPIAHLYKTQVYQLAEYLKLPEEIVQQKPTTDTYSMSQSQEEFYFSVSHQILDCCLYGLNHGLSVDEVSEKINLNPEQVEIIYNDIRQKRQTTAYQHMKPVLIEPIKEV